MAQRPSLILAHGKEKALLRRHPWIFSGAVKSKKGDCLPGDLVDIYSSTGQWMAVGHYQNDSIVCKVISYDTNVIDRDFWYKRFQSAVNYRKSLSLINQDGHPIGRSNAFRLVHGEGDFLPGLIVDYYNGVVVMQAHSEGMYRNLDMFADIWRELLPVSSVFNKSASTLPQPNQAKDGYLWGDEPVEWEMIESDNRLLINFFEGQKTGFFIDQRDNRYKVMELARGKRVLNCFGYTGGFSLAALRGGASYVETVDISKKAIALADRNVHINFGDNAPHKGVVADVTQYLDCPGDLPFDIVILDPPAFAKNHRNLQQGLKGYRHINQKAFEKMPSGSLLFTFSCSQAVSRDDFQTMIFTSAANAKRKVRIVQWLTQSSDHPVSIYHPEGEYLKGLLLQVE